MVIRNKFLRFDDFFWYREGEPNPLIEWLQVLDNSQFSSSDRYNLYQRFVPTTTKTSRCCTGINVGVAIEHLYLSW